MNTKEAIKKFSDIVYDPKNGHLSINHLRLIQMRIWRERSVGSRFWEGFRCGLILWPWNLDDYSAAVFWGGMTGAAITAMAVSAGLWFLVRSCS